MKFFALSSAGLVTAAVALSIPTAINGGSFRNLVEKIVMAWLCIFGFFLFFTSLGVAVAWVFLALIEVLR